MNSKKEVAKFFAGAAAWEAVGHALLAFSGMLPLTVWGITWTQPVNTLWILVVAAVSILLGWYAWGTSEGREPVARTGGAVPAGPPT